MEIIIDKFCINKDKPTLKCNGKCYLMSKIGSSVTNKVNKDKNISSIKNLLLPLYFKNKKIKIKKPDFFSTPVVQNWNNRFLMDSLISKGIDPPPPKSEA